jgi:hypothetical protein
LHFRAPARSSLDRMEEARAVLERLDRIERLDQEGATPAALLNELRALVADAERWARREGRGTTRARLAVDRCRRTLAEGGAPVGTR